MQYTIDNDDGLVDAEDPSRTDGADDSELNACEDTIDNDGDGWVDLNFCCDRILQRHRRRIG